MSLFQGRISDVDEFANFRNGVCSETIHVKLSWELKSFVITIYVPIIFIIIIIIVVVIISFR